MNEQQVLDQEDDNVSDTTREAIELQKALDALKRLHDRQQQWEDSLPSLTTLTTAVTAQTTISHANESEATMRVSGLSGAG